MSTIGQCENTPDRRYFLKLIGGAGAVGSILPFAASVSAAEMHNHAAVAAVAQGAANQQPRTEKTWQTAAAQRELWLGHIFWIRNVSFATLNKNDAAAKTADEQVIANAHSIAGTFEPFYGAAAKDSFFKLLAGGHYGAVKAYLVATADGNATAQATATEAITSNAEDIADFFSKANPYLPKDELIGALLLHGAHHIQQIQELKERKYDSEASTWEEMKNHIYHIADATADALAKQFPKAFE
jgi:hypothetical protein